MTTLPPITDSVCAGPPQGQWTVADVLAYCPADDGNRYELINGVVWMTEGTRRKPRHLSGSGEAGFSQASALALAQHSC